MAAENKPQSGVNIAGHVIRWLQSLNRAVGREQRRKAEYLRRLKSDSDANKKAGLPKIKPPTYNAGLTDFDMRIAAYALKFTRDGLEWFASAEDTALELLCSENAVHISRKRLVKAGFLIEVAETYEDTMREGRPANRYRIPDIFPNDGWGKEKEVFPTVDGEMRSPDSGVSPTVDGGLSPSVGGPNSKSVRGQTPKASVQSDQSDQNHDGDSDKGDDDYGDLGRHEPALSPITASESFPYTEADLESDRVYDGQVDGDCETLDPEDVQEIDLSEIEGLRAEEEAAARYHDDQGRQAWAAVSRRVLEIRGEFDDVAVFLTMHPRYWPGKDLIHAFAEAANAMPAKWRIGSRWKVQEYVKDDPEGEEECHKAYAKVRAAVADLASRLDSAPIEKTAVAQAVANG